MSSQQNLQSAVGKISDAAKKSTSSSQQVQQDLSAIGKSAQDFVFSPDFRQMIANNLALLQDLSTPDFLSRWQNQIQTSFREHPSLQSQWENLIDTAFDVMPRAWNQIMNRNVQDDIQDALQDFRTAMERVTEASMQDLWSAGQDWFNTMNSSEFGNVTRDLQNLLVRAPVEETPDENMNQLVRQFNENPRIKDSWNNLLFQVKATNQQLMDSMGKDWKDLLQVFVKKDANGQVTGFNFDAFSSLPEMLPLLTRAIHDVPIPKIDIADNDAHFIADNLRLKTENLVPGMIGLDTSTRMTESDQEFIVDVVVRDVNAVLDHVVFMYFSKTVNEGDAGVANVEFDVGFHLRFHLNRLDKGKLESHAMTKEKLEVNIDNVDIKFVHTKHEILNEILKPVYKNRLASQVEDYLSRSAHQWFETMNQQLTNLTVSGQSGTRKEE